MKLDQRCARVKLFLSDVDGILTDGGLYFDNQGIEIKRFHVRDGSAIKLWQRAGLEFGLITGRSSHIVQRRAAELGITLVRQAVDDKFSIIQQIVAERGISIDEVAFAGDDYPDVSVLTQVGLGITVADAPQEVKDAAHYTTSVSGGQAAIREAVEFILRNQRRWDDLIQKYLAR